MSRLSVGQPRSVTPEILAQLHTVNIKTYAQLLMSNDADILAKTSLVIETIVTLREEAIEQLSQAPKTAHELCTDATAIFSTGSVQLNQLLGGGMEGGSIIELFGHSCTYKSQMALQAACRVALDGYHVLIMDSNAAVSTVALEAKLRSTLSNSTSNNNDKDDDDMDERLALNEALVAEASGRMVIAPCHDHQQLLASLQAWMSSMEQLATTEEHAGLIVVDSIAQVYSHRLGMGHYKGQRLLQVMSSCLRQAATALNIPILVINHARSGQHDMQPTLGMRWRAYVDQSVLLTPSNHGITATVQAKGLGVNLLLENAMR
eukprot:TRINITY_DN9476_c0_g1_i2.p1 TRINITY_DN9476_c0_g1~~TRINITY_DN9476_c0_g1_i2.p1  ORF type:complete len:319 (+),score=45.37 TRINITY_DN9476_c0_g1_i2:74-1030(+)